MPGTETSRISPTQLSTLTSLYLDINTGENTILLGENDNFLYAAPGWSPDSREMMVTVYKPETDLVPHLYRVQLDDRDGEQLATQSLDAALWSADWRYAYVYLGRTVNTAGWAVPD